MYFPSVPRRTRRKINPPAVVETDCPAAGQEEKSFIWVLLDFSHLLIIGCFLFDIEQLNQTLAVLPE